MDTITPLVPALTSNQLDFPANPNVGDVFMGWTWDGTKWIRTPVIPPAQLMVSIGPTPPTTVEPGFLWWDSIGGNLYIWYTDPTGSQWVIANVGIQGLPGTPGPPGPAIPAVNMLPSVPTSGDLPATGNNPGDGRIAQDTGDLWIWDGTTWFNAGPITGPVGPQGPPGPQGPAGPPGGSSVTVTPTPPASPVAGNMWFDSNGAQLYVWDGAQWVIAVNPPIPDYANQPTINQPVIMGVTDGSAAVAGQVGELLTATGTVTPTPSNATVVLASLSLTPGEWLMWASFLCSPASGGGLEWIACGFEGSNSGNVVQIVPSGWTSNMQQAVPAIVNIYSAAFVMNLMVTQQFSSYASGVQGWMFALRIR